MKTRAAIYAKEAAELLRTVSLYKLLDKRQVFRLFPGKEKAIKTLLSNLIKQKRIAYNPDTGYISAGYEAASPDLSMIAAFWVLLDFIEKAEFHTIGEYPVKISFFSLDGECYEIIHVPMGRELLISRTLSLKDDDPCKRLIIVENTAQIADISINGVICFCLVSNDGAINYYKAT